MPAGFRQCGPLGLKDEGIKSGVEESFEQHASGFAAGFLQIFVAGLNAAAITDPDHSQVTTMGSAVSSTAGTIQQLKQNIVAGARAELKYWSDNGLTERRTNGKKRIQAYWKEGAGRRLGLTKSSRVAWSAAFIDYVIKKAGAGARFKYAWKHVTYIKASIENLEQNNSNPFRAYPVDDARAVPEKGDLVCNWRKTKRTYDDIRKMKKAYGYMHCDIVVDKSAGKLKLIGGNKSGGKVAEVEIALDTRGLVVNPGNKYIAVIKVEDPGSGRQSI